MRIVGGFVAGWVIMLIVGALYHNGVNITPFGYWPVGAGIGVGLALILALTTPSRS